MSEFEPVFPDMGDDMKKIMLERKRKAALRLGIAIALVLVALACVTHSDGAYNYNVTLQPADMIVQTGQSVVVNAYVAHNNAPVKEFPCILNFYDAVDNATLISERIYTDELGQFHYSAPLSDVFQYGNNYTYTLSCSNTTMTGSMTAQVKQNTNWLFNMLNWLNENTGWGIVIVVLGVFMLILAKISLDAALGK